LAAFFVPAESTKSSNPVWQKFEPWVPKVRTLAAGRLAVKWWRYIQKGEVKHSERVHGLLQVVAAFPEDCGIRPTKQSGIWIYVLPAGKCRVRYCVIYKKLLLEDGRVEMAENDMNCQGAEYRKFECD
jgi:hypothetical protein